MKDSYNHKEIESCALSIEFLQNRQRNKKKMARKMEKRRSIQNTRRNKR